MKHYATAVGAPAVQQLRGAAHHAEHVLFYALSGFTKAASDFAESSGVALFTYDLDAVVTPSNFAAQRLLEACDLDRCARPEHFELEQVAKRKGQQYFDMSFALFSDIANAILEQARAAGGTSPASRALSVESQRVEEVLGQVHERSLPLTAFMGYCEEIQHAAKRLQRDYLR